MDPSRFVLWLVADVLLGLIHVIIFSAKVLVFSDGGKDQKRDIWMPFLGTGVLFAYTITLLATHLGQLAQALLKADVRSSEDTFLCVLTAGIAMILLVICTTLYTLTSNDIINEAELGVPSEKRNSRRVGLTSLAIFLAGLIIAFLVFYISGNLPALPEETP